MCPANRVFKTTDLGYLYKTINIRICKQKSASNVRFKNKKYGYFSVPSNLLYLL